MFPSVFIQRKIGTFIVDMDIRRINVKTQLKDYTDHQTNNEYIFRLLSYFFYPYSLLHEVQ